jgi:hypothetical protein
VTEIEPEVKPTISDNDTFQFDGRQYDKDGKETPESIKKRARKPPPDGPCKMCGQMKRLNRLLLCYGCWLNDKLHRDSGGEWLPGDPHPAGCGCDGPGGCATKSQGN